LFDGLPTEFAGLTLNPKIIIGIPKHQNENFSKIRMFSIYLKSEKEPKIHIDMGNSPEIAPRVSITIRTQAEAKPEVTSHGFNDLKSLLV
jgi:hypothetical protein